MKRKKSLQRTVWAVLALFAAGLLFEAGLFMFVVAMRGAHPEPKPADVLIVLGALVHPDGQPSETLANRIDLAARLYHEGYAPAIITSGAQGRNEPATEARTMARRLISLGVPESAIIEEDQSYSTRQNLSNSKVIMDAHQMETAIIVTSDYHLWRALFLAERAGISAEGVPAPMPKSLPVRARNYFRETLSIIHQVILRR